MLMIFEFFALPFSPNPPLHFSPTPHEKNPDAVRSLVAWLFAPQPRPVTQPVGRVDERRKEGHLRNLQVRRQALRQNCVAHRAQRPGHGQAQNRHPKPRCQAPQPPAPGHGVHEQLRVRLGQQVGRRQNLRPRKRQNVLLLHEDVVGQRHGGQGLHRLLAHRQVTVLDAR